MSHHNTPTRQLVDDLEDLGREMKKNSYDADFTAAVSNKMQVPHRISLGGLENDAKNHDLYHDETVKASKMRVPDRIIVAGQEQHVAQRETPRDLDLEMLPQLEHIGLRTPPRVLKLEECKFPSLEDQDERKDVINVPDGLQNMSLYQPTTPVESLSPPEELAVLRRQMSKLSRRVIVLEEGQQVRQQRELFAFTLMFGYMVLKALSWLRKNW